jgi:hypothetical protein
MHWPHITRSQHATLLFSGSADFSSDDEEEEEEEE